MTTDDAANQPPTVQQGYEWLNERIADAIERLTSISVADDAVILDDDKFFHPIHRTLSQEVAQCLLSALDHLRALVRGLRDREKPYPYAQATLIRTAITAGATGLWLASGSNPTERRVRAMGFMYNDLKSQLAWMDTTATKPMHQQRPAAELTHFSNWRADIERRIDWILQEATTLLNRPSLFSRRQFGDQTVTDRQMVKLQDATRPASATVAGTPNWCCSIRGRRSADMLTLVRGLGSSVALS
ncbi:MAG: hypothetical protein JWR46_1409 [Mycobacterium sp.]|nr:hypothetical protein [Mycobacterium sp.]